MGSKIFKAYYREQETTEWPGVRKTDRGVARNYGILEESRAYQIQSNLKLFPIHCWEITVEG